jgi:hypothetical protein
MTEEWVYYKDLDKQYSKGEILDLLRKGLQPYGEKKGRPQFCPTEYHGYFHYYKLLRSYPGLDGDWILIKKKKVGEPIPSEDFKRLEKREEIRANLLEIVNAEPNLEGSQKKLSWNFVWMPEDTIKKEELFSILQKTKFYKKEYEELLAKKLTLSPVESSIYPALIKNYLLPEYKDAESLFYQTGSQTFIIIIKGLFTIATAKGKTIDGFIHIANLLQSKDSIKATDLYGTKIEEHSYSIIDGKTESDIKEEINGYKEELAKLESQGQKESPEYIELNKEYEKFINDVTKSYKVPLKTLLVNRPKEHSKNALKAKETVRKRIERAIVDISGSDKSIAEYFDKYITCGHQCIYKHPSELPAWKVFLT